MVTRASRHRAERETSGFPGNGEIRSTKELRQLLESSITHLRVVGQLYGEILCHTGDVQGAREVQRTAVTSLAPAAAAARTTVPVLRALCRELEAALREAEEREKVEAQNLSLFGA